MIFLGYSEHENFIINDFRFDFIPYQSNGRKSSSPRKSLLAECIKKMEIRNNAAVLTKAEQLNSRFDMQFVSSGELCFLVAQL